MKKLFCILLVIIVVICVILIGVSHLVKRTLEAPVEENIETLKELAVTFEDELEKVGIEKEQVDAAIEKIEELNEETNCVIAFNIQNNHSPFLGMVMHFPVPQEFFDSVNEGDIITSEHIAQYEELAQLSEMLNDWTVTVDSKILRDEVAE